MKKAYIVLIVIAASIVALSFFKDLIIKTAVTMTATRVLGTPVHIDGMSVGFIKQSVRIKGLRVDNPPGFPSGVLMDIPEIGVDYDLPAILKGNLHLRQLILNLKELNVIRNPDGKLNVDALKVVIPPKSEKNTPMQIDTAVLNLEQATLTNRTQDPPVTQTFNIGINRTYHNIQSAQQLATLIIVETLRRTAVKDAAIYGVASLLHVPTGLADELLAAPNQLLKQIMGEQP